MVASAEPKTDRPSPMFAASQTQQNLCSFRGVHRPIKKTLKVQGFKVGSSSTWRAFRAICSMFGGPSSSLLSIVGASSLVVPSVGVSFKLLLLDELVWQRFLSSSFVSASAPSFLSLAVDPLPQVDSEGGLSMSDCLGQRYQALGGKGWTVVDNVARICLHSKQQATQGGTGRFEKEGDEMFSRRHGRNYEAAPTAAL